MSNSKSPIKEDTIRVLHVDDDPSILEVSKQILVDLDSNFQIDEAWCVEDALQKLSAGHYDVVVSDYEMPQKDGLEFLKQLKGQNYEIPFILFTGKGREEVAIKALNLGAQGYYNKQGSPETVYGELAHGIKAVAERARIKLLAKSAEEALKQSNERIDRIIDSTNDGIGAVDNEWNFVYVNRKMAKAVNCEPEQMVGKNAWASVRELVGTPFEQNVREAALKRKSVRFDFQGPRSGVFWEMQVYPSDDGLTLVCRDITEHRKSEQALLRAKEDWERTFNSVPDFIAILDNQHKILRVNQTMAKQLGVTPEQAVGLYCFECVHGLDHPPDFCPHTQTVADGKEHIVEVHAPRLGGEFIVSTTPLKDVQGKLVGTVHVARNISERKKTEEKLKQLNSTINTIINSGYHGIYALDKNWNFIYVNERMAKLVGSQPGQMVGKNGWAFFSRVVGTTFEKNLREAMEKRESKTFEWTGFYADKAWEINVIPYEEGLIVNARDITELKRSESRFRSLCEDSPDGIIIADLDGQNRFANPAACSMLGMTEEEIRRSGRADLIVVDERLQRAIEERGRTGKARAELKIKRKDGTTFEADITSSLFKDTDSTIRASIIIRDITERKKVEEALADSEAKYRALVENADDAILLTDLTGKCIYRNPAYFKSLGFDKDEELTLDGYDRVHPEDLPRVREKMRELFETGYSTVEYRVKHHNGSCICRHAKSTLIYNRRHEPYAILTIIRDITERRKAEAALAESEAKYRELVDRLPEMVFEIDTKANVVFANARAYQLTGYSKEEFDQGFNAQRFVAPEDLERSRENMKKMFGKDMRHANEYMFIKKDGTRFPVSLSSAPVIKDGKVVGARGIAIDISERKKVEEELRRSHDKLELMNEKLRVVGGLTRHDVRNKLTVINSNMYLLKKKVGGEPELAKYLAGIQAAAATANRLFEFSQLYERIGAEEQADIDVKQCFDEAVALFSNLGNISIVNECTGLTVVADKLLRQLFYNLIDNSLKHGEKVTLIRLRYAKEAGGITLFYEDNGVGIPDTNKCKIFNEGFTTGGGTGLGLAMMKKMAEVYGWNISEQGEPGKGAKFVIAIPNTTKIDCSKEAIEFVDSDFDYLCNRRR